MSTDNGKKTKNRRSDKIGLNLDHISNIAVVWRISIYHNLKLHEDNRVELQVLLEPPHNFFSPNICYLHMLLCGILSFIKTWQ